MATNPTSSSNRRVVDPEFEIFWKEVGECVRQVELNKSRELSVERGTRRADVSWAEWDNEEPHQPVDLCGVQIEIYDIQPKQPELITPGE